MAQSMAGQLADFDATALIYLRDGGQAPGQTLARELGLPASGLDIRYPLSRVLDKAPGWLRPTLLVVKELTYRMTAPKPAPSDEEPLPPSGTRVILFDDSASTGRTIRTALKILATQGIPRECVCVTVLRCGSRARPLVDHFAMSRRVSFVR
ncbi:MAG: phosphoribosyltransferase [Deltaproteobacteria bacterium]|nr:phosphoribosyltransferase [Deltaproteobacteria bacterium]